MFDGDSISLAREMMRGFSYGGVGITDEFEVARRSADGCDG